MFDLWYGSKRPKWLKLFNKKSDSDIRTLDYVEFRGMIGCVFQVFNGEATVMVSQGLRVIPYNSSIENLTKLPQAYDDLYSMVKRDVMSEAWQINLEYDRRKVEELKLRKQIGKLYRREYQVEFSVKTGVTVSTIIKLDKPVLEDPQKYLMSDYIPICRNF